MSVEQLSNISKQDLVIGALINLVKEQKSSVSDTNPILTNAKGVLGEPLTTQILEVITVVQAGKTPSKE